MQTFSNMTAKFMYVVSVDVILSGFERVPAQCHLETLRNLASFF